MNIYIPLRFRLLGERLLICSFYHSFLRLFDKKMRPRVQARVQEAVVAAEAEHTIVRGDGEVTAEQEQAFACVLIIVIGNKG